MSKDTTTTKADTPFAIIEIQGKQYTVSVGDIIEVDSLAETPEEGENIAFNKVLMYQDGATAQIGEPYLEGAQVHGIYEGAKRAKKVNTTRFRAKSRHFRRGGFRHDLSRIKISSLK